MPVTFAGLAEAKRFKRAQLRACTHSTFSAAKDSADRRPRVRPRVRPTVQARRRRRARPHCASSGTFGAWAGTCSCASAARLAGAPVTADRSPCITSLPGCRARGASASTRTLARTRPEHWRRPQAAGSVVGVEAGAGAGAGAAQVLTDNVLQFRRSGRPRSGACRLSPRAALGSTREALCRAVTAACER